MKTGINVIGVISLDSSYMSTAFISFFIAKKEASKKADFTYAADRILLCKTFYNKIVAGSFFSCIYGGKLRIHVVFNEDVECFDEDIFALITKSMDEAKVTQGKIWLKNKNERLISIIGDRFQMKPDSEPFFYDSTEYVMRRDKFNKRFEDSVLEAKPYEETHIDQYLELLNDAMSFFIPPEDFVNKKEHYLHAFEHLNEKRAFEAFWKDDRLVGLYWLGGTEVDTMGVSSAFQRRGYGEMILTRAIENVFLQNPNAEYAVLYAVGWNAKAQSFYKKYGMEVNGQYRVPYVDEAAV